MKVGKKFYYILIAILVIAIALVVTKGVSKRNETIEQQEDTNHLIDEDEPPVVDPTTPPEHTISTEIIEEGLQEMGFLVTQEYDCTGVLSNSKMKSILGINLPFTESSYLVSYDATVTAGIDFTNISVEIDETKQEIIIHLPEAQIGNVSIDPDSFTKYEEKDGLGTKMTITDYNDSLQQFEETVTAKAIEKGLLEKAAANAQTIIANFVQSIITDAHYHITVD